MDLPRFFITTLFGKGIEDVGQYLFLLDTFFGMISAEKSYEQLIPVVNLVFDLLLLLIIFFRSSYFLRNHLSDVLRL